MRIHEQMGNCLEAWIIAQSPQFRNRILGIRVVFNGKLTGLPGSLICGFIRNMVSTQHPAGCNREEILIGYLISRRAGQKLKSTGQMALHLLRLTAISGQWLVCERKLIGKKIWKLFPLAKVEAMSTSPMKPGSVGDHKS